MPWMFSSTLSLVPYLLGWLGFLVALARGAFAAIAFAKPARAVYAISFAAAVLIEAGDFVYLTDLAASVDPGWSGLRPVPAALIEPGGSLRSEAHWAYPPVEALNASIRIFWWSFAILVAALLTGLVSLGIAKRSSGEDERPRIHEPAIAFIGAAGLVSITLRFVA